MTLKEAIKWTEHYGVQNLPIPSNWVDTFWNNDAMYSYEVGNVRIWIDCVDHKKSEMGYDLEENEYNRFHVVTSDIYNDGHDDHYCDDVLMESNDFNEIVAFVDEKAFLEIWIE